MKIYPTTDAGACRDLLQRIDTALAAYETILAAYPYNEWPDAAACGAAECYVALGDKATARVKFNEVVKSATATGASAKWGEVAKKRINELNKGE